MFQRVFNQHTFKKIIVTIQPISEVNFPVRMLLGLAKQCSQEVERKEVGIAVTIKVTRASTKITITVRLPWFPIKKVRPTRDITSNLTEYSTGIPAFSINRPAFALNPLGRS